jgi:ribokinase
MKRLTYHNLQQAICMPDSRVLVAGGINLDTTYRVNAIPVRGESVCATGTSEAFGGKGLNQALAIRRAGLSVGVIATVGSDSSGDDIRKFLESEDISTSLVSILPNVATGRAIILVDDKADNAIVVDLGANALTDVGTIDQIGDQWSHVDFVVANGEAPAAVVCVLFAEARAREITTVWNPSPMPAEPAGLLKLTDILIVNEPEAEELSGLSGRLEEIVEALQQMGPPEIVVTLGQHGSIVAYDDQLDQIPTPKVDAVDPTAAGDTFLGYYVAARADAKNPDLAASTASAAAALCVQRLGASNAIPSVGELEELNLV